MITEDRSALILAISLAGLAGFIDALGFLKLGGFFISFMSGNSTRFAVGVAEHGWASLVIIPLALITLFVIGVILGSIIHHLFPRKPVNAVLGVVTLMLLLAAISATLDFSTLAIVFMVIAMGIENNVFVKEGQVQTGVTYMTGTLVKLGQKLAGTILGKPNSSCWPFLFLWMGLVSGAVLGSISYTIMGLGSLWIAAGFATLIFVYINNKNLFQ